MDCAHWPQNFKGDRNENRQGLPQFEGTVQWAAWALQDATELYRQDQTAYADMIYHGTQVLQSFSWQRAIREYRRIYDRVCK